MKTVRNVSRRPLRIQLSGGKILYLGPSKTGQVSDQAIARPSFRKLVDEGQVEIVGEGEPTASGADSASSLQESTHGHPQPTVVMPKGNR